MSLKRVFVIMRCFYLGHALDIMLPPYVFVWRDNFYLFDTYFSSLMLDCSFFFFFFVFESNNFACNFFEKNMTNEIFLLVPFIYTSSFWLMLMAVLKFLSFFFSFSFFASFYLEWCCLKVSHNINTIFV